MSIGELTRVSGRPFIQGPLVLDGLPQPSSEPSSPLLGAQGIPSSLALRWTGVPDELRTQPMREQRIRIDSRTQLVRQQTKALVTEASLPYSVVNSQTSTVGFCVRRSAQSEGGRYDQDGTRRPRYASCSSLQVSTVLCAPGTSRGPSGKWSLLRLLRTKRNLDVKLLTRIRLRVLRTTLA